MIKYYWKQAWELLKQHKLFSVLYITGAGLAIAMTMVVFVAQKSRPVSHISPGKTVQ